MSHSYFFDHCLSPRIAAALKALGFDTVALADQFPADTPDEEWLQQVKDRVVVTADRRMKKQQAYQQLMTANARTVVFLAKSWKNQTLEAQAWRIVKCWWELDREVEKGHAYELSVSGTLEDLGLRGGPSDHGHR